MRPLVSVPVLTATTMKPTVSPTSFVPTTGLGTMLVARLTGSGRRPATARSAAGGDAPPGATGSTTDPEGSSACAAPTD